MAEFCRNVSEAHTCFKEIFLYTPAVLSSYIKHEFSAQVKNKKKEKKSVGMSLCTYKREGIEQNNL